MLNNKNKNYNDEDIIISGYADIWNKNYKVKKAKNHILQYGLMAALALYSTNITNTCFGPPKVMQVGTDTSTTTNFSMSSLISPLTSSSNITYPNTATLSYSQPSGTTQWQAVIAATWNAGALPNATIGEVGLYGNNLNNSVLTRIASADGSFSAFTNNNTYALNINYVINFNYQ